MWRKISEWQIQPSVKYPGLSLRSLTCSWFSLMSPWCELACCWGNSPTMVESKRNESVAKDIPNIWYDHYSLNMTVHILLQWFLIYCLFWNSGSLATDVCWHQKWFSYCVSYLSSLTSLEKTLVSFLLVSGPNNYHGYNIINKNHLISMPRNSAFKFSIPNCNLEELPLWFPEKRLAK